MSDSEPKSCSYDNKEYASGQIICKPNPDNNDQEECMQCQDGTWVPTGKKCQPAHDPGTACNM